MRYAGFPGGTGFGRNCLTWELGISYQYPACRSSIGPAAARGELSPARAQTKGMPTISKLPFLFGFAMINHLFERNDIWEMQPVQLRATDMVSVGLKEPGIADAEVTVVP